MGSAVNISPDDTVVMQDKQFPAILTWTIAAMCILPFLLMLAGIDFGNQQVNQTFLNLSQLSETEQIESIFQLSSGSFTHTILEWSAFCAAIFTAVLAFAHYRISHNPTVPIIAAALFCSGCMDAFHTLAADRLIDAVADNNNLIPFTWAISRTFNAVILIMGAGILLFMNQQKYKPGLRQLVILGLFFFVLAFVIIHYCATSTQLPQTLYPNNIITRPWDVGPLLLYLLAGLFIFPYYYRHFPSIFSYSLIVSMIPDVATELHMSFGSLALYDAHFNIAHFLKILAYLVPFIGLVLDYIYTHEQQIAERSQFSAKIQAEQNNREKFENIAKGILDTTTASILTIDEDGLIQSANPSAEQLFAYTLDELLGKNVKILMPAPYQNEHDGYLENYEKTGRGAVIDGSGQGRSGRELTGLRKNGETFPMELSLSEQNLGDGKLFTGIILDITERKQAESDLITQTQALSRSNEELERFAYIASHDLQEPLRMVASYTKLLSKRYKDKLDDDANEFIDFAVDGATRMQDLIRDLLAFSRVGSQKKAHIDIDCHQLAKQLFDDLSLQIKENNCSVTINQLPSINAEKTQMRQLFQNLISNAIKYTDQKNKRENEIEVSAEKFSDPDNNTEYWKFSISDTGIGIEAKHYTHIFEIFRRLHNKTTYSGTGLGLALCKRIVELHKGELWLESEVGQGSIFYFTLPITQQTAPA